jgi:hypothetical protein
MASGIKNHVTILFEKSYNCKQEFIFVIGVVINMFPIDPSAGRTASFFPKTMS